MAEFKEDPVTESDKELISFITSHCDRWREHKEVNYEKQWDESVQGLCLLLSDRR